MSEWTSFLRFEVVFRTRYVPPGQGLDSADPTDIGVVAAEVLVIDGMNTANMMAINNVEMVFFIIFSLQRPMERYDLIYILALPVIADCTLANI
jgi:hypothetical protein